MNERLTRTPTPEDARRSPLKSTVFTLDQALRVIGEQSLQMDSQRRALEALNGIMFDDAQRVRLLTEARDDAYRQAREIASEFAAAMAIIHNALPGTSGRLAQSDLEEVRVALDELSEVALDYHSVLSLQTLREDRA
jgi:soluble cytochrome b562